MVAGAELASKIDATRLVMQPPYCDLYPWLNALYAQPHPTQPARRRSASLPTSGLLRPSRPAPRTDHGKSRRSQPQ